MVKKKPAKKKGTKKKTTKKKPEDKEPPAPIKVGEEEPKKTIEQIKAESTIAADVRDAMLGKGPGEEPPIEKELDQGKALEQNFADELLQKNQQISLQNDQLRAANEELTGKLKQVITAYRSLEDKVADLSKQESPTAEPAAAPGAAPQPQPPATAPPVPPAAGQPGEEERFNQLEQILIQNNQAIEGIIGVLEARGLYTPSGAAAPPGPGTPQVPVPAGAQPGQPGTLKDLAGRFAMKWLEPESKEKKLVDKLMDRLITDLTNPPEDAFSEMGKQAFSTILQKGLGSIGGPSAQDQYNIEYAKARAKLDAKRIGTMLPEHEG